MSAPPSSQIPEDDSLSKCEKAWERETGRKEKVLHEKPVARVPGRRQAVGTRQSEAVTRTPLLSVAAPPWLGKDTRICGDAPGPSSRLLVIVNDRNVYVPIAPFVFRGHFPPSSSICA